MSTSATIVQLTGGSFQDAEGNLLVNGYLKMKLSQDGTVTGVANVASGIEITIQLNSSASVSTSPAQYIWGNDNIVPTPTFYTVTGYTAAGQPAWGPNNQQVTGGPTFDVGTWVPNAIISWSPTLSQPLVLKTNGVLNGSQVLLDVEDTASITWANTGGQWSATAASGGPSFSTAGEGWFFGGQNFGPVLAGETDHFQPYTSNGANKVLVCGLTLDVSYTISKVGMYIITYNGITQAYGLAGIYSADGLTKLLDAGTNAFNVSYAHNATYLEVTLGSPVTLSAGYYLFAYSCTDSYTAGSTLIHGTGNTGGFVSDFINGMSGTSQTGTVTRFGEAANVAASGALPATLGALTPYGNGVTNVNLPAVLFMV